MFKKTILLFISLILIAALASCTTSTNPSKKTTVTFKNVFWSEENDVDGDGYKSSAKLNFETEASKNDVDVFVIIGIRYASDLDTATYNKYFTSTNYVTGTSDAKYVSIGLPNQELSHGCYDFKIQMFEKDKPNDVLAEANISSFTVMKAACFETVAEEIALTLTFTNPVFTDIEVTLAGKGTKTAPVGGSAVFTYATNPGTISLTANTSGKTTQGTRIGELVGWTSNLAVTGLSEKTYNLNVVSTLFFVYITNSGTANLSPLYVNYGRAEQSTDNIVIPHDNVKYRTGYFKAFSDTEVLMTFQGLSSAVHWVQGTHFTLPWVVNQKAELLNTLSPGGVNVIDFPDLPAAHGKTYSLIPERQSLSKNTSSDGESLLSDN